MNYTCTIEISLKEGMLDPEARAIRHALTNLGFQTEGLKTARIFRVVINAADEDAARAQAEQMCGRLLANPVIHEYAIEVAG